MGLADIFDHSLNTEIPEKAAEKQGAQKTKQPLEMISKLTVMGSSKTESHHKDRNKMQCLSLNR
nr:hypothetical protein [uncultured Cohaesibacter sp.]